MQTIAQYSKKIHYGLRKGVETVVIIFAAAMVIDVLLGIFSRQFMRDPFFWTEELGRLTMIYSGCLAIALALPRGLHIGITFVLKKVSQRTRIVFDVFSRLCIAAFLILITIKGIEVCGILSMQVSPTMGYNMVWLFIVTPITCVLQLIFLILMTIEDVADGFVDKHLAMRAHDAEF